METRTVAALAALGQQVDVPAGSTLTREGRPGREFFVLLDGSAVVERAGAPVAALGPGDFFGEIALLTRSRRTATVTTMEPSRLLVLGDRAFREATERMPDLAAHAWAATAARL